MYQYVVLWDILVGTKITELITDEQLEQLEALVADDADVLPWLEKACPDYKKIVQTERAKFRRAILRSEDKAAYILRQKS